MREFGASWAGNKERYNTSLFKSSLKLAIDYFFYESYFILDNICFRQLVGVPYMASLLVYNYEKTRLNSIRKETYKRLE